MGMLLVRDKNSRFMVQELVSDQSGRDIGKGILRFAVLSILQIKNAY
jgi:hypothetical protein